MTANFQYRNMAYMAYTSIYATTHKLCSYFKIQSKHLPEKLEKLATHPTVVYY